MKKITVPMSTTIRSVMLMLALFNQLLTLAEKNPLPFSEAELYQGLTVIGTVAASLWNWWKNNSFTEEALAADELMQQLRKIRID